METKSLVVGRLLLAKLPDEERPVIVGALDETIWEHSDETVWDDAKDGWPDEYEWREVVAHFDLVELRFAFAAPTVQGRIPECS